MSPHTIRLIHQEPRSTDDELITYILRNVFAESMAPPSRRPDIKEEPILVDISDGDAQAMPSSESKVPVVTSMKEWLANYQNERREGSRDKVKKEPEIVNHPVVEHASHDISPDDTDATHTDGDDAWTGTESVKTDSVKTEPVTLVHSVDNQESKVDALSSTQAHTDGDDERTGTDNVKPEPVTLVHTIENQESKVHTLPITQVTKPSSTRKRLITWEKTASDNESDEEYQAEGDEDVSIGGDRTKMRRVTRSMTLAGGQKKMSITRSSNPATPTPSISTGKSNKKSITLGSYVLAKYLNHPYWAGFIGKCSNSKHKGLWHRTLDNGTNVLNVFFMNDYTSAWVEMKKVIRFELHFVKVLCDDDNKEVMASVTEVMDRSMVVSNKQDIHSYPEDELKCGDIVIAKYEAFPLWPGIIEAADNTYEAEVRGKVFHKGEVHIRFYPDNLVNWVPVANVRKFSERLELDNRIREVNAKYDYYMRGIDCAKKELKRRADLERGMEAAVGMEVEVDVERGA